MRYLWITLLVGISLVAELRAQSGYPTMGIGVGCNLAWSPPTAGALVQGYKIYLKKQVPPYPITEIDVGNVLEYSCEDAGLDDGPWEFWVKAYNTAGDGESSWIVPFRYYRLIRLDVGEPFSP